MAKDVSITFEGEMSELKNSLDRSEQHVRGWADVVKGIGVAAFAGWIGSKFLSEMGSFFSLASEQIEVETRLESVLKATGNAAGFTADELKKMAGDLQQVTLFGDEATIAAQAMLATFTEVRGDEFERTIKVAQDMATVLGGDLTQSAQQLGKALTDPERAMSQLARQGVVFSGQQQQLVKDMMAAGDVAGAQAVILDQLEANYAGAAEAAAGAAGGGMKQFWNIVGDIKEVIGTMLIGTLDELAPMLKTAAETVQGWAEAFVALLPAIKNVISQGIDVLTAAWGILYDTMSAQLVAINSLWVWAFGESATGPVQTLFDFVKSVFMTLTEITVAYVSAAQVMWQNVGETAEFAWNAIQLAAVTWFEQTKHNLTVVIPELLRWFFDNWKEIFTDLYMMTGAILNNMFENVVTFFKGVWDWLVGNEASFEFRALTEGFESSLKELPQIAERELSELEKVLTDKVGQQGASLAEKFSTQFAANMAALGFGPGVDSPDAAVAAAEAAAQQFTQRDRIDRGGEDESADQKAAKEAERSSGFASLQQLFNRIQTSAASGSSPELKAAEKTAEAADETAEHTAELVETNKELLKETREMRREQRMGGVAVMGP